ncbi:MAG: hypothetical protein JW841_17510 [Deltaproteobacteria bacterium]|nr:hypothetical protein [Deltaproteobacteria bacterium]
MSAFWSLIALQLLVFLPVTAWILHNFADWSLLYLFDTSIFPQPAILSIMFLSLAIASFLLVRSLLIKNKKLPAIIITSAIVLIGGLSCWFLREPLLIVGSFTNYQHATNMRPLQNTSLFYLILGGAFVILFSWLATCWRLMVFSFAAKKTVGNNIKVLPNIASAKAPERVSVRFEAKVAKTKPLAPKRK